MGAKSILLAPKLVQMGIWTGKDRQDSTTVIRSGREYNKNCAAESDYGRKRRNERQNKNNRKGNRAQHGTKEC